MIDVLNYRLINVGGRIYRAPAQLAVDDAAQQDVTHVDEETWQEDDMWDDHEDDILIDDSLITKDGDLYASKVYVDAEVCDAASMLACPGTGFVHQQVCENSRC